MNTVNPNKAKLFINLISASEQYFPVHGAVLTLESLNEILWCDHSNVSC